MKYKRLLDNFASSYYKGVLPHAFLLWSDTSFLSKFNFVSSVASKIIDNKNKSEKQIYELIQKNSYSDFIKIAPKDKGSIKNEDIEMLDSLLPYSPYESKNRIIYIENASSMTISAQNSLLKKLEEPPEGNYFFLTVKKKNSLLQTVVSRSLPVHLPPEDSEILSSVETDVESYIPVLKDIKENSIEYNIDYDSTDILIKNIIKIIESPNLKNYFKATELMLSNLDSNTTKRNFQLKFRIILTAYHVRHLYPNAALLLIHFYENKQVFSPEANVFGAMNAIFKEISSTIKRNKYD